MKETVLHVRGIHTPRLLLWCCGFLHGVMHTGTLDPETDRLASGYITGQIGRFRKACICRRDRAETLLSKEWNEADQLLIDLAALTAQMDTGRELHPVGTAAGTQARAADRAAKLRADRQNRRLTIVKRLAEIFNTVCAELDSANSQMEATAELLLSGFSCYGHGLLMKPVHRRNLPDIFWGDCSGEILMRHEATWNGIRAVLQEGKE